MLLVIGLLPFFAKKKIELFQLPNKKKYCEKLKLCSLRKALATRLFFWRGSHKCVFFAALAFFLVKAPREAGGSGETPLKKENKKK
jgi:hypothetical protein